jgi:hypothetical protein
LHADLSLYCVRNDFVPLPVSLCGSSLDVFLTRAPGWLAGWLDGWMVQVLHIQLLQGLYHRPSCCSAPGRPPDGPRVICRRVRSQDIALSHRSPCHLCNQWQKLKVFCCADTCTGAAADCRWVSQADWSRCRDHSDLPSAASKRHGKGRKQRCVTLFMRW